MMLTGLSTDPKTNGDKVESISKTSTSISYGST